MTDNNVTIKVDDLTDSRVIQLLTEHHQDMLKHSPPESVHALNLDGLKSNNVTFWTIWKNDSLAGCGALKDLDNGHGELKSMRASRQHLRQGIASLMLEHIIAYAVSKDFRRLSLETGSMKAFEPARLMYQKYQFDYCAPFADYIEDVNSMFMTRSL